MPFGTRLFERLIRKHRALLACPAHRKLHREHRQSHYYEHDKIDEYEYSAAVLSYDKRKSPYVSYADGTACTD